MCALPLLSCSIFRSNSSYGLGDGASPVGASPSTPAVVVVCIDVDVDDDDVDDEDGGVSWFVGMAVVRALCCGDVLCLCINSA